jgi:subtilisin family serine protease
MKNYYKVFFLLLFCVGILNISYTQKERSKIHPTLLNVLATTSVNENVDVYVRLKNRYPIDAIKQQTLSLSKKERQREIVRVLKDFAEEKQQAVLKFLRAQEKVDRINILWATNTIVLSAAPEVIYALEKFDEIMEIRYDRKFSMSVTNNTPLNPNRGNEPAGIDPGIILIRADDVWAEGYYGQGVFIASIDEGCNWDHPDLINNLWQNLAEDADGDGHTIEPNGNEWVLDPGDHNGIDDDNNGYVDDLLGWDFVNEDNQVYGNAHGTSTVGVAVGDGTLGTNTGVAPQAKIVNLRIGTNSEQQQTYCWLAMQYAIDLGVDIITHSQSFHWDGFGGNSGPPDVAMFRDMAVLELEAGIIHFTSISNDGRAQGDTPIPFNISTPGNCPAPWLHPDQTLVGGTTSIMGVGNVYADSDVIHSTSPYGPSSQEDYSLNNYYPYTMPAHYWDYPYETQPGSMGLLKPDISSPGAHTISLDGGYGNYGYSTFSGTSSATPHAAGTAALLLSVNPNLTPVDISRILQMTAIDKGEPGHDRRYGAGRIDAYLAFLEAQVDTTPPALLSATANSSTEVKLFFSESLDSQSSQNTSNYNIDGGINVLNAVLINSSQVTLITSQHLANNQYSITVNNITDLSGNVISPTSNSAAYSFDSTATGDLYKQYIVSAYASHWFLDFIPNRAIDGISNPTTQSRWAGAIPMPDSIIFDLGSPTEFSKTRISFYEWDFGRIYEYAIKVSYEMINWQTIISNTSSSTAQWSEETFSPVVGRYLLLVSLNNNQSQWAGVWETEIWGPDQPSDVATENDIPSNYALHQNYPNPFNPETNISFSLPENSRVSITVYDLLGKKIADLVDEEFASGSHTVSFDAVGFTSGIYLYRMQSGKFNATKKLILMK